MHHRRLATATTAAALGATLLLAGGARAATTLLPADIDALPRAGAVESGEVIVKLSGSGAALKSKMKGTGEVKLKGSTLTLLANPDADQADPASVGYDVDASSAVASGGTYDAGGYDMSAVDTGMDAGVVDTTSYDSGYDDTTV